MEDALIAAKQLEETRQAAGFDQSALDQAARQGFNNGAFEDTVAETDAIVEEFFPVIEDQPSRIELPPPPPAAPAIPSLAQELESRASQHKSRSSVQ